MKTSQTLLINGSSFVHTRTTTTIPPCDLLKWLDHQTLTPKLYWKHAEAEEEIAGVGQVCAFSHIPHFDSPPSYDVRFFGGKSFYPEANKDNPWQEFPACYFFLPAFEIVQTKTNTLLSVHEISGHSFDPSELSFDCPSWTTQLPKLRQRYEIPSYPLWERQLLDSLLSEGLEKIVFARRSSFVFDCPLCSWHVLSALKNTSSHVTLFGLQIHHTTFIGATPEMLYEREKRSIVTAALAGTRPRGKTEHEDSSLEYELLYDEKEKREFDYVKQFIHSALFLLCDTLESEQEDAVIPLAHVQHILNRFKGSLKPSVSDETLLSCLHPTPAVGGYPMQVALEHLKHTEQFDRGWYAAPIGWIGYERTTLAVAIRSALFVDRTAHLFAGTGIVKGSEPGEEWNELEHKMSPFLDIFKEYS